LGCGVGPKYNFPADGAGDVPSPTRVSRRTYLTRVGGAVGLASGLAGCVAPTTGTDETERIPTPARAESDYWSMGDHDAGATGHNPRTRAVSAPGDPRWTRPLPSGGIPKRPVVGPDRLYVVHGDHSPTLPPPSVAAYSLADGTEVWWRSLPFPGFGTPALAPDGEGTQHLFVLSGAPETDLVPGGSEVWALDPATGERRWRWSLDDVLHGPVVVADGRLFVRGGGAGTPAVHARDAATGDREWRLETGPVLHHTPTVAGERLFVSTGRERLAAVHTADGSIEWERPTRADTVRPVVDAERGTVLMGHSKGLQALSATTGAEEWELTTTGLWADEEDYVGVIREPMVTDDLLFVAASDTSPFELGDPGELLGVDPQSGDVQWSFDGDRPPSLGVGASGTALAWRPAVERAGADTPPSVTAVGPDGSVRWSQTGDWMPVAVAAGRLICYRRDPTADDVQYDVGCFALDGTRAADTGTAGD
jgi:outer membrane protein assembly factor BamB